MDKNKKATQQWWDRVPNSEDIKEIKVYHNIGKNVIGLLP